MVNQEPLPVQAQSGEIADEVRAQRFIVVDEKGERRMELSVGGGGPRLAQFDEQGRVRAGLAITEDESGLILRDDRSQTRVLLRAAHNLPALALYDGQGEERAKLMVGVVAAWRGSAAADVEEHCQ